MSALESATFDPRRTISVCRLSDLGIAAVRVALAVDATGRSAAVIRRLGVGSLTD